MVTGRQMGPNDRLIHLASCSPDNLAPMSEEFAQLAELARTASQSLALATRATKDEALLRMAQALRADETKILAANVLDIRAAEAAQTPGHMIDRLRLDEDRLEGMARGLEEVAGLPDPVGEVLRGSTLPNGLQMRQVRVPFGVVGIIYEARPNVTADAAGICLKSGNAALLRGSSSALNSNQAIITSLRAAAEAVGLPSDVIALVPGEGRESAKEMMRARGLVDVLIPRGGASLIQSVVTESTVPVIETGVGNCHVYVDGSADLDMAVRIVLNAKTHRPSVCNAAESLLVHAGIAEAFVPRIVKELQTAGVTVHGDQAFAAQPGVVPVQEGDFDEEYLSLDMSAAVVADLDEAISHIRSHSSGHTDAIVTDSQSAASRFVAAVDSAAVLVNASTRFTDGGEFGFGAEIGISTQKLHARGPMGLPEMTSTKYVVTGAGHIR